MSQTLYSNTVTAVITSFPKLTVRDTSVNIELDMNTTLVPDGSDVTVSISSNQTKKPISDGKFSTTINDLKSECQYDYREHHSNQKGQRCHY